MRNGKFTIKEIDKYIDDLPKHRELAKKIADYVNKVDWYNLAQVAQLVEVFYGEDSEYFNYGGSIAQDINCLWRRNYA